MLGDGSFVVTWRSDNQDGSAAGVYGFSQMAVGGLCTLGASLGSSPALSAFSVLLIACVVGQLGFRSALKMKPASSA